MADLTGTIASIGVDLLIYGSIFLVLAGVIGLLYWYNVNKKKYDTTVIIIERQKNGQYLFTKDIGGFIRNFSSKTVTFHLKNSKSHLKTDDLPFIILSNNKRLLFLEKKDISSFVPFDYQILDNKVTLTVTQEDLTWAKKSYGNFVRTFNQDKWKELLALGLYGLVVVGVIILIAMLLKKFDVLATVSENLIGVTDRLSEVAQIMKTGTVVLN